MALIIPVGFGHAVYEMQLVGDNEPIVVTCGHDLGAVVGGDYAQAATDLFDVFAASWMGIVSGAYELTAVNLYVGQDGGPPMLYESSETPVGGGESGGPLPQNCAALVKKATSSAGRRGRGRIYLPGIAESAVDHIGTINGTFMTALQAGADLWLDELTTPTIAADPYPPVILHRSEGIGEEPPPTPVTAFVVDGRIATQRKRLRR